MTCIFKFFQSRSMSANTCYSHNKPANESVYLLLLLFCRWRKRALEEGEDLFQSQNEVTEPALEPRAVHSCQSLMGKAKNLLPLFLPKYPSTYAVNTMQRWANSLVTSKSSLLNFRLLASRASFLSLSNSLTLFLPELFFFKAFCSLLLAFLNSRYYFHPSHTSEKHMVCYVSISQHYPSKYLLKSEYWPGYMCVYSCGVSGREGWLTRGKAQVKFNLKDFETCPITLNLPILRIKYMLFFNFVHSVN